MNPIVQPSMFFRLSLRSIIAQKFVDQSKKQQQVGATVCFEEKQMVGGQSQGEDHDGASCKPHTEPPFIIFYLTLVQGSNLK